LIVHGLWRWNAGEATCPLRMRNCSGMRRPFYRGCMVATDYDLRLPRPITFVGCPVNGLITSWDRTSKFSSKKRTLPWSHCSKNPEREYRSGYRSPYSQVTIG
jgi:hypothetical protein